MTFKSLGIKDKKLIQTTTRHLLKQIAIYYSWREALYGENIRKEQIFESVTPQEINRIYCIAYGVYSNIEKVILSKIDENPSFKKMIARAVEQDIEGNSKIEKKDYTKILCDFIEANQHLKDFAEEVLLLNYYYISDYCTLITFLGEFTGSISSTWTKYLDSVSEAFYLACEREGRSFLCEAFSPVSERDMDWLNEVRDSTKDDSLTYQKCLLAIEEKYGRSSDENTLFRKALSYENKEHLEKITSENYKHFSMIRQMNMFYFRRFRTEVESNTSIQDTLHWIGKLGEEPKKGDLNG